MTDIDNRDLTEVNKYLEARVEALVARIRDLEAENTSLREIIDDYTPRMESRALGDAV